ncbi:MAG TPA: hypothetical protein VK561_01225 [Bradyrhizobium sp.]|nr:hypothetical protein [Bradyrhizobium sp.]
MSTSRERRLAAFVLISLAVAALTAKVAAQQGAARPDFSSNQTAWIAFGNDFIAPASGPRPVTYDPARPFVQNNSGEQPTFRIADLSNSNLKPWAKEKMKKANDEVLAGEIALTARSSCRPGGVPGFMLFVQNPVFMIQTAKQVHMIYSGNQEVRRIYLNVPHSATPKPSWYGESVGHYEGDTLVVDTIGVNTKTLVDNYRTPHTDKLHVMERWRLINDGKNLEVNIKVEDPDTFYEPWSAIQRYRRVQQDYSEQVCAENNTHFYDYKIPRASKPDF